MPLFPEFGYGINAAKGWDYLSITQVSDRTMNILQKKYQLHHLVEF